MGSEEKDILNAPWAHWLEGVLKDVLERKPDSIAILTMSNDYVESDYYETDNAVRSLFISLMQQDFTMEFISTHRDYIRELINGEDES